MADDLDPILIQVTIPLPIPMIYRGLIEPDHLTRWLSSRAEVEPHVGGRYELVFEDEPRFTVRGRITRMTPDVDVGFGWTGPTQFDDLLNGPEPSTEVYVRLQESPEGIDVTLEHVGWKSGDAWEEARSWHFHFWDDRMHRFKDHLIQAAYG